MDAQETLSMVRWICYDKSCFERFSTFV